MQPLVVCQACTSIALTIQTGLESLGLSHKVKGWPGLGGAGPCEGGTLGVVPRLSFLFPWDPSPPLYPTQGHSVYSTLPPGGQGT